MTRFIVRRLIQSILVIFIVTIFIFLMMHLLPGDPILMLMTGSQAGQYSQEQINQMRHEYGLDRPLITQYANWISGLFHGDLGYSLQYRNSVTDEIVRRLPITLHIGVLALIIGFVIGLPAGIICAVRRGTWIDTIVTLLANAGITIPVFWLGIMLLYLVALKVNIFPIQGYVSPFDNFGDSIMHVILPLFCVAIFPISGTCRQARSSMLEVMRHDYIRTAWSKGLRERVVIIGHALKNALIPVIILTGLGVAGIIGGEVLVEQVFNIPGMGRFLVSSVLFKDYQAVQGVTLVISAVVLFINLVVDVSVGWFDPRIRFD